MRGVAQQDCHFGFRAFEYVIVKVGLNLKLTLRLFRVVPYPFLVTWLFMLNGVIGKSCP